MREMALLLKTNIRSSLKSFISIIILLFIVSLSVTTVISVRTNSANRVSEAMTEDGFGDMWVSFVDSEVEEKGMKIGRLREKTLDCPVVDRVNVSDIVWANEWKVNGGQTNNSLLLTAYGDGGIRYRFFDPDGLGLLDEEPKVSKGKVVVPLAYQSLYNCEIGDTVLIEVNGKEYGLEVQNFMEDPIMGSTMMGVKTIIVSEEDMAYFLQESEELPKGTVNKGTLFHIFQSENSELTGMKLEREINKQANLTSYATFKLTASESYNYMTILVNIFSGILMVFVALLVFVALIIIGHSISNSMELDYVNMGVLKAVGYSGTKLKMVYALQYGIAVALGSLLGIPCGVPLISVINHMTRTATGLQVSGKIAYGACLAVLLGICVIIVVFILFKVHGISHVTPVRAIRNGRREVYFTNRLSMGIHKRGLGFWLALRQVTSNKRQYISACIIAAVLVFFLGMTSSMKIFMGGDSDNIEQIFSATVEDISIYYDDGSIKDEAEEIIASYSPIASQYCAFNEYLTIDGGAVYTDVIEDGRMFRTIVKGRECRYDNEIVVTEFLAKELGIQMGDMVMVSYGENKESYLVTGYYQNASDAGNNFGMTLAGYEKLTGAESGKKRMSYVLEDKEAVDAIRKELEERYKGALRISSGTSINDMAAITSAVDAIAVLIYVIATVFVLIAILLICGKLYLKEQKDFGIYKAVGYSTESLRAQFAARFAIVAAIGGVLGIILYLMGGNFCASGIFYFVGVSSFEADTGLMPMVVPFVFVAGLFLAFAWLAAGRIKKASPRMLIA